ncbi:hypothetical protein M9Y10_033293 [Tritrichomonas musculus]|uniref:Protein kinase domain-containing protein n=1 Tax=Tritrichomonas musculus TaxID=1915356 RepID=A0ABR2KBS1_9EUKA
MSTKQIHVANTIIFAHDDGTKDAFVRHEVLGRGTFGIVFRVTDQKTNKDYAIKAFPRIRKSIHMHLFGNTFKYKVVKKFVNSALIKPHLK